MNKRVQILLNWFQGKRNNVTLSEILAYTVKPSHFKAGKTKIENIVEEEDYYIVTFKNINSPLYWPKKYGLRCLYGVAGELLNPPHWHYYEVQETKVDQDDIVLDCGASEGLFALSVANRCKKVYAIEPLGTFIDAMKLTFEKINNVEIVPIGLSDCQAEATINENDLTSSLILDSLNNENIIKLDTIDNLFYDQNIPVNYIKADLEGFELKMLAGAKKTISKYLPKMAITTYHDPEHADQITNFLKNINEKYNIKVKGIEKLSGTPIMLHAWV